MKKFPRMTIALTLLRALHTWSERAYHRELLRCELRRIGREMRANGMLKAAKLPGEISGVISRTKEGRRQTA